MKKVEIYDGCFGRDITIDNIDFNEYNKEELINLIKIKLKDESFLREVFEIYIQNFSIDEEYGDRSTCEQCGHWCSSQTYFF
mgnify:FL=1